MNTENLSPASVSCERSEPEGLRTGQELATAQLHDGRVEAENLVSETEVVLVVSDSRTAKGRGHWADLAGAP